MNHHPHTPSFMEKKRKRKMEGKLYSKEIARERGLSKNKIVKNYQWKSVVAILSDVHVFVGRCAKNLFLVQLRIFDEQFRFEKL